MAKKEASWLQMPKIHSKFNDEQLETALINKSGSFLRTKLKEPSFIFLSGCFFDVKSFSYSAVRSWKGAAKPSGKTRRKPLLESTFASLSVYLSSLLSLQSHFHFAYEEIKEILLEKKREDLWSIVSEKLPFVSLPPKEMYGGQLSPISPYFVIKQDDSIILGELYPSVFLTSIIKSIKPRFFVFFQHQGYSSFGFFNSLPERKKFGFEQEAREFTMKATPANLLKYTKSAKNLKEVMISLIHCHNNAYLAQMLIADYEILLNKILGCEL